MIVDHLRAKNIASCVSIKAGDVLSSSKSKCENKVSRSESSKTKIENKSPQLETYI